MPLLAASFLKSSSQVSNVPVPQAAANTGAAGIMSSALTANALRVKLGFMKAVFSNFDSTTTFVAANAISVRATAAKTRLRSAIAFTNLHYPSRLVYRYFQQQAAG